MTPNLNAHLRTAFNNPHDEMLAWIAEEAAIDEGHTRPRAEKIVARVVRVGQWRRLAAEARTLLDIGHPDRAVMLRVIARAAHVANKCPLRLFIRFNNCRPRRRCYVQQRNGQWPPVAVVDVGAWWILRTHLQVGTVRPPEAPKPQSIADGWGGYL